MTDQTILERAGELIRHRADCETPRVKASTGRLGDQMAVCKTCRRFALYQEAGYEPGDEPPPAAPRTAYPTGYVCREHHNEPVTFKGTGCAACRHRRNSKPKKESGTDE